MQTNNVLICTVGLPRSGKSTWSRSQQIPIVNPDSIRLALYDQPFIASAEPFVWAIAKTMVKALFVAGHSEVILDATNTTRKRRDEWYSTQWFTQFKVFGTSVDTCIERAHYTGREDLIPVIKRMAEQFEPLEADEEEYH